jgi:hypothetical protein
MSFRYNTAAIYSKSGGFVPAYGDITQAEIRKRLGSSHPLVSATLLNVTTELSFQHACS